MSEPTRTGNPKVQILSVHMYMYLHYQTGKQKYNLIQMTTWSNSLGDDFGCAKEHRV